MFKRTRIKIVITIMALLFAIFIGALFAIYVVSYRIVAKRSYNMLNAYARSYEIFPDASAGGNNVGGSFSGSPDFLLSTFYAVAFDSYGKEVRIENNDKLYSDRELAEKAKDVLTTSVTNEGKVDDFFYVVSQKGDYSLVIFMDNTVFENMLGIFTKFTVIFGCVALGAFGVLACFIAHAIVRPVEENYKKQKQFVSDAGHELKTPISAINVNADMLLREIGENKWLSNIRYENERLNELVRQLLILARTEKVNMPKEVLDFSRLTEGEVLPLEVVAYEKNLTIKTSIEQGVFVRGNSAQLKQLVSILVTNAIQYATGDDIELVVARGRRSVRFSVINDGKAMGVITRRNIFERFYRVDDSHDNNGHYGLGLAIAKAIVTSHGGKIKVSCREGKVAFVVSLKTAKPKK